MKKLSILAIFVLASILFTPVSFAGYGTAPNINQAPTCGNQKPGQTWFTFIRKSGSRQIEVGWTMADRATSWTIAYGKESGKYIYGMPDFGDSNSRSVKINMLPPGTYYVVIKANNGCMPGNFSPERKITVYGNGKFTGYQKRDWSSYFRRPTPTPIVIITNVNTGSSITPTPTIMATPTPILTTIKNPTPTITPAPTPVKQRGIFQRIWIFFFGE